jgi:methylmalonyl-CoA/ethylmalonyl-CoA epimerase
MQIHHVGYVVADIDAALNDFQLLGFRTQGERCADSRRNINIQFISNDSYTIELVAPMNEASPVGGILKKLGCTPYHLCYQTADLATQVATLKAQGFSVIAEPEEAPAINEQKVAFLFKKSIGIVELVEQ